MASILYDSRPNSCFRGLAVGDSAIDRLRDVVLFVSGAIAIVSLILALYEGFNQRVSAAVFLSGLFVACALMVYLPKIEVFKAFGVEAKLQKTVTEAVATLASLKRLAEISAKASYLTMAWGNRLGTPPAREKQAVLDDIDAQLAELKVSPDEIAKIQIPFVKMVRVDFLFLFQGVLNQYATILNSKLVEDVHQAKDPSAATGLMMRHSDLITAWTKRARNDDPAGALEKQSLEDLLNDFIPKSGEWLSDKELAVVQKFKAEIVRLNADCEKRGGYTTEASTYYDRYSGEHNIDKAKQLRNEVLQ
jgi:hypothetical protein